MIKQDTKCKNADKEVVEPIMDGVAQDESADATTADADNVSDESFESNDNSAQVADESELWRDKYMRLSAEFDNYRKRTLKEKMDLISTGGEDVIKTLLPIMDDIDRALAVIDSAKDLDAVKEGIVLISQKLGEGLKSKGLAQIESVGLPLDTDLHEAVAKFPAGDENKGKIIDVVQKGYKLKDKVVRHAKVVVGE